MKKLLSMIVTLVVMLFLSTSIFVITSSATQATTTASTQTTSTSYEEEMPVIQKGSAYLKVNFKLPEGEYAGEKGLSISIHSNTTYSNNKHVIDKKNILMAKGLNSYTTYLPISTAGESVRCYISYSVSKDSNYVGGHLSEHGTSPAPTCYTLDVKDGSVQEITLNAIEVVPVSGNIQLSPDMKIPKDKQIKVIFGEEVDGLKSFFATIDAKTIAQNPSLSFTTMLPIGYSFNVYTQGIYNDTNVLYDTMKVEESDIKNGSFNYCINISAPQKVRFADAGFEKAVKKSLEIGDGDICDYMLKSVTSIDLKGDDVKTLSDLSKTPNLTSLSIESVKNTSSYLPLISSLNNLQDLYIGYSDITDISFLKDFKKLTKLDLCDNAITDISLISNLTELSSLDLNNNKIIDFSPITNLKKIKQLRIGNNKAVNLDCLKKCVTLEWIDFGNNFQLKNIEFIKSLTNLKTINTYGYLPLADLSCLSSLNKNIKIEINGDSTGKNLDSFILINNTVKKIIENIIKPGMNDFEKALAVHDYICLSTTYDYNHINHKGDDSYAAYDALVKHSAVCYGYSSAYWLIMNTLGIDCSVILSNEMNHAWNLVKIDNQWYHVDCTWDNNTSVNGSVNEDYFLLSDAQIQTTHKWDAKAKKENSNPPACLDSKNLITTCGHQHSNDIYNGYIYDLNKYGISRSKTDGSEHKVYIVKKKIWNMMCYGNYIFYIPENGKEFYRVNRDGTGTIKLFSQASSFVFDVVAVDNSGVWMLINGKVELLNFNGKVIKSLSLQNISDMQIVDKWIYFRTNLESQPGLYRVDKNGNQKKLITKRETDKWIITTNSAIFIDNNDNNKIISVDLKTGKEKVLANISCSYFFRFDQWLYYTGAKDKRPYRVKLDGSQNQKIIINISEMK